MAVIRGNAGLGGATRAKVQVPGQPQNNSGQNNKCKQRYPGVICHLKDRRIVLTFISRHN
jgi:hypothetical protein